MKDNTSQHTNTQTSIYKNIRINKIHGGVHSKKHERGEQILYKMFKYRLIEAKQHASQQTTFIMSNHTINHGGN